MHCVAVVAVESWSELGAAHKHQRANKASELFTVSDRQGTGQANRLLQVQSFINNHHQPNPGPVAVSGGLFIIFALRAMCVLTYTRLLFIL